MMMRISEYGFLRVTMIDRYCLRVDVLCDGIVCLGTGVKQGTGTMMVTCVGLFSEEGIINRLITGNGADEVLRAFLLCSSSLFVTSHLFAALHCRFLNLDVLTRLCFLASISRLLVWRP